MLFHILKLTRKLRLAITRGREPSIYDIGRLPIPLDLASIHNKLSPLGYQYNYMSLTSYPKQVFQLREHNDNPVYQRHLRFYKDGHVTGHYEYNPEYRFSDHCKGIGCRPLAIKERLLIWEALQGDKL